MLGGQGVYVRLASSGLSYNSGTGLFSFNVTVQNLSSAALATTDGATRDTNGLRVFFNSGPATTVGTGTVDVLNATGQSAFTGSNQSYYQYGGQISGVDQSELGADGLLSTGEVSTAKNWQFNVPSSVTSFAFTVYVATEMAPGTPATAAPQITAVSPNPLVPGAPATITGTNFNAVAGNNAVLIGGTTASVSSGNSTQLTVTVPCVASGTKAVNVTTSGMRGADFGQPLTVTQRPLSAGQTLVLTTSSDSYCNELPAANAAARYVVAVFSASTSPASTSPFKLSGDPSAASVSSDRVPTAPTAPALDAALAVPSHQSVRSAEGARHAALLEANAAEYTRLRARFGTRIERARMSRMLTSSTPPLTRSFRVPNVSLSSYCNSYYVVNATRVYYNGKMAIYEDDATAAGYRSTDNPLVATAYQTIGDEFNADVEPMIRTNFGDILRRDASTDDNGVEVALFTPRINTSFSGVASFTTTCDQFPNDDAASSPAVGGPYTGSGTNGASNFGEVFYGYEATTAATDFSTGSVPAWTRAMRREVVHESKHIASYSARVANNAPSYESGWLEESMARMAEEMWARPIVDNLAWKSNAPYGSFANPVSVYCDLRPTATECNANPRRPLVEMLAIFNPLYTELFGQNARLLSPFGATASDTQRFYYAVAWSLLRYAVDQYGASEAAFFTDLTQATTTGVTNLTARTGTSIDQLLGNWALSLYADDFNATALSNPLLQMPTWNLRSIYAGLNTDPNASGFTLAYPLVPTALTFGTFAPTAVTTLRGGGVVWYEITGTQSQGQLLRLQTNTGGLPSTSLRIAVARLQ